MAYINKVKITVANKYLITAVNEVKITSGWKETIDKCSIKVPGLESYLNKDFKEGDKVKVELSMSTSPHIDDFKTEFEGYIERVDFTTPFTLHCENEAYVWKRKPAISKQYPSIQINDLFKDLFGEAVILSDVMPKFTLTNFLIRKATPYEVLQKLKQEYLLTAYFRGNKLLVGTQYLMERNSPTRLYHLDGDRGNVVGDQLIFRSKESIKLKARAVCINKDGTKLEATVGDEDGGMRTLFFDPPCSEQTLKDRAEVQLKKLKRDTMEGSIQAFGLPYIRHSDLAKLKSEKYPQKNGTFFVDQVESTFGTSGFRRQVTLGVKLVDEDPKKRNKPQGQDLITPAIDETTVNVT